MNINLSEEEVTVVRYGLERLVQEADAASQDVLDTVQAFQDGAITLIDMAATLSNILGQKKFKIAIEASQLLEKISDAMEVKI